MAQSQRVSFIFCNILSILNRGNVIDDLSSVSDLRSQLTSGDRSRDLISRVAFHTYCHLLSIEIQQNLAKVTLLSAIEDIWKCNLRSQLRRSADRSPPQQVNCNETDDQDKSIIFFFLYKYTFEVSNIIGLRILRYIRQIHFY